MNKSPEETMGELHAKFGSNYEKWTAAPHPRLSEIFLLARAISEIGQILKVRASSKHHERCILIFDEVFADIVSATYLACCAIDKPAGIVLRRVIELGVASIYLWDLPHVSYAWASGKHDLSFTKMVNHINSEGYKLYVADDTDQEIEGDVLNTKPLTRCYGELSDIIHGKIDSFESNLPDAFEFSISDWDVFSKRLCEILEALLDGLLNRFNIRCELLARIPALNKPRGGD